MAHTPRSTSTEPSRTDRRCEVTKVALTGATGLIGPHILTELREHDHEAVALVRDAHQAGRAAASAATPVVVDLYDRPTVVRQLSGADGAVHTASPGAAASANLDAALADPAIGAFVPGSDEEARATLRRLFRRSPPARSGHACRQGSGRTRVVLDTSRTRRRASPWQLQQAADGLNERLRNNDLDRNSDGG
jgi:hypothetical protein